MGIRYDKKRASVEESGTMWTSYSDLFLALSVIFLLLYVVASLKQSTSGLVNSVEQQRMAREVEELKSQLRVYNTLKEDYVADQANEEDRKSYEELTNKLSLLQDSARQEKEDLRAQATENEKKEKALNHYQKLVRSIINANMVAQARIKRRDTIIEKKDEDISQQTVEIAQLEKSIASKEATIKQSEKKIAVYNSELSRRMKELRRSYENQNISKKKFEAETNRIKEETQNKVAELREKEKEVKGELSHVKGQLANVSNELEGAKTTIVKQSEEKEQLNAELEKASKKYASQIQDLKGDFESQRQKDRAAFEKELATHKMTVAEKARREAEFKAEAARKQGELNNKIMALNSKVKDTEGQLANLSEEKEKLSAELDQSSKKYAAQVQGLKGEYEAQRQRDRAAFEKELAGQKLSAAARAKKEAEFKADAARKQDELNGKISALNSKVKDTEGQLARAKEVADAKKKLIANIKANLAAGGVSADVDPNSGDVILNFGEQYFDSGRADLKPMMKQILEKAVPLYSKSLFHDSKIADKIASVEIMGFASPTYQGRVVDPSSLSPEDKKAVNYNMDLSYERAKKIFEYVFDTNRMQFSHQKQLYPLVKVSGRSYLAEAKKDQRGLAGDTIKGYCQMHDCSKAQKVIIKFTMKD